MTTKSKPTKSFSKKRHDFFSSKSKARCYFCKRLISKHKPKESKTCLMMVSAYTSKIRSIYSRPDIKKAVLIVTKKRLRDAHKRIKRRNRK